MPRQRPNVTLVTVVWGDWHSSAFFGLNLPTLFAPGNLPALIEECTTTYDIYARSSEVERIGQTLAFRLLQRLVPVRLNGIAEDLIVDPIRAHHELWLAAIDKAKREDALVLLMPPDVAWSDGSLGYIGRSLARGRKAIFNCYLRVVSDTFARSFVERYQRADGVIAVPPREMVAFSMPHIHPLMTAYSRDSENFPHHPEMIIWPVRGEGLLVRVLARECLLFDPKTYSLNEQSLIAVDAPPDEIDFAGDSDQLFAVSLAPLGKDMEWCSAHRTAEFTWIGRWWLDFDSPLNDLTAATKLRIHYADPTESTWRQVEFGADLFVRRAAIYREAIRIWQALHQLKCERAAEWLALAIHSRQIAHVTPASGRFIVLAPADEQLYAASESQLVGRAGINGLIRAHVAVLPDGEPEIDTQLVEQRQIELTALDGSRIRLRGARLPSGRDAPIVVNDRYKVSGSLRAGRNLILRLEGMLTPG
jgi:hypothetical protein